MKNIFLTILISLISSYSYGLNITDKPFEFTGKISSITLNDNGGVINAVGNTSQYGKVWLTYNLKLDNPNSANQG